MRSFPHILLALTAAFSLCLQRPAQASQEGDSGWVTPVAGEPDMFSIEFPGGSLGDYLRGLQEAQSEQTAALKMGVVWPEEAEMIPMPKVSLRSISLDEALYLPGYLLLEVGTTLLNSDVHVLHLTEAAVNGSLVRNQQPPATFNLRFQGGELAEYVAAIDREYPHANVVLMPGVEHLPVPPVDLKEITLSAALEILNGPVGDEGESAPIQLVITSLPIGNSSDAVYKISAKHPAKPSKERLQSGVWSVAEILSHGVAPDEVLTAVEAAIALYETPVQIRFHEKTAILLARGRGEQIAIIDETLRKVLESAEYRDAQAQGVGE